MGSMRLHFIFIFIKLFLIFFETTSAVHIENFNLFKRKLTLKADSRNIIPCAFNTRRPLNSFKVQLEWGFIPEGKDEYKPLVHLFGTTIKMATPDLKDKYQLFIPLVAKGNCSLVIDPTEMKDKGTYQVKLIIKEKEYKPLSSIKVEVVNQLKPESRAKTQITDIPPMTIAEKPNTKEKTGSNFIEDIILPSIKGNEKKFGIILVSVTAALALYSVIGIILCVIYSQHKKKDHRGDVENPPQEGNDEAEKSSDKSETSPSSESSE